MSILRYVGSVIYMGADLILLAEDNDDEVALLRAVFDKARISNPVRVVSDGVEAIAYLRGDGPYANREEYPLPALLLLDLKMSRMDGLQVLAWVRQQPQLKGLRTIVLTGLHDLRNVNRAYQLGAHSFLLKPVSFLEFVELVRALQRHEPSLCLLPEPPPAAPVPTTVSLSV